MKPYDKTARILDNLFVLIVMMQLATLLIAIPMIVWGAIKQSPFIAMCGCLVHLVPLIGLTIIRSAIRQWFDIRKPGVALQDKFDR